MPVNISISFSFTHDADLLAYLEGQPNKSECVRDALRHYMNRENANTKLDSIESTLNEIHDAIRDGKLVGVAPIAPVKVKEKKKVEVGSEIVNEDDPAMQKAIANLNKKMEKKSNE